MSEIQVMLVTAALAALIAIWGVVTQRQITRRKSTLELIARLESDKDFIEARTQLLQLSRDPDGLAKWASDENKSRPEAQSIRLVLNQFELVSIGIQRGVLDGEFWKLWFKTGTLKTWSDAEPFVKKLRERIGSPMSYHEFEELAKALQSNRMPKRNWWLGRFF